MEAVSRGSQHEHRSCVEPNLGMMPLAERGPAFIKKSLPEKWPENHANGTERTRMTGMGVTENH